MQTMVCDVFLIDIYKWNYAEHKWDSIMFFEWSKIHTINVKNVAQWVSGIYADIRGVPWEGVVER